MKFLTAVWTKPIKATLAWLADLITLNIRSVIPMQDERCGQLCPNCRTGKETYLLDKKEPFCPYIQLHKGDSCVKYSPLVKIEE